MQSPNNSMQRTALRGPEQRGETRGAEERQ